MSRSLNKILKADMPILAELIRSKGRRGDTILAHINPREAALLQSYGGAGTTNPDTGLLEFYDGMDYPMDMGVDYSQDVLGGEYGAVPGIQPVSVESTPVQQVDLTQQPAQEINFEDPRAVAAAFPELYPGGQLPAAGQQTYYLPGAEAPVYGAAQPIPTAPGVTTPAPKEDAWYKSLGLSDQDVKRLGLGALIAAPLAGRNVQATRQAQRQAQAATQELRGLGEPYQRTGREMQRAAQAGELTPAGQRTMDVARAQMAQAAATRGGVGAEQMAGQLAALQNQLLAAQYDLGLKITNIGDQYVSGAIRTGMQADQMINQANNAFYASLAQMAAPFILGQQPIQVVGGYPVTR